MSIDTTQENAAPWRQPRQRPSWAARTMVRAHELLTAAAYAVLGMFGVLLWLVVQLPMSARWKESLVYLMIGCLGLFAMGWQLLRASHHPTR
jgi:predicted membrane channel-forming protein YqfA (hemolysin III family)